MGEGDLERTFDFYADALGLPKPVKEYRFHPPRRWRFDRVWPEQRVAVELEGGIWSRGRHVRGAGFERDCEKYNTAAVEGWTVLRFTASMLRDDPAGCIGMVRAALGFDKGGPSVV